MITIPKFRTASKQNIRTFALPSENQTYTFKMQYAYDSYNRIRLSHLRSYIASGTKMQDITYSYDSASNITHVSNSAGSVSGLGGRYEGHYTYDNLYRLVAANGYWKNSRDSLPFSESMNYTANGRILKKTVNARILSGNHSTTKSSDFRYNYAGHGNQVSTITDNGTFPVVTQSFQWDDCGNVDRWAMLSKTGTQWLRTHTWTEDNRLQTVADNNWFSYYQYDAGGERTYKLTWAGSTSNRSGDRSIYYTPDEATLYASPYFVVTPQGYTKHYYAESERITSQLGKGQFADVGTPVVSDSLVQVKLQEVTDNVEYPSTLTVPSSGTFAYLDTLTNQQNATSTLYFYHPDHLGSSSWITTTNGTVKQHLHYLPWGETYVDQKSNRFDGVRYTFSAKEKDTETGYSYFGARYYSSDLSIWLSVDPMSDKYPSLSPYVYCANNPVKLVDPNGCELWKPDEEGNLVAQQNDNAYSLAQYLNTTPDIAIKMLEEQNYTVNENGVLNLKVDDVFHVDYGYCRTRMDYIGAIGEYIGSLSKLGLGEDIFGNYWLGLGDVELTGAQFAGILMYIKNNNPNTSGEQNITLKGASGKTYPGKSKVVDFYGSSYERLFGRATLYYNQKGNIVGFYDEYNFDPKPLGTRSLKNEIITRGVNFVSPKCSSSVSIRYGYSKS